MKFCGSPCPSYTGAACVFVPASLAVPGALDGLPAGSVMTGSLEALPSIAKPEHQFLIAIENRPNVWRALAQQWLVDTTRVLEIRVPREESDTVAQITSLDDTVSLAWAAATDNYVSIGIVAASAGDSSINDWMSGFAFGQSLSRPSHGIHPTKRANDDDLLERYISVLEALSYLPEGGYRTALPAASEAKPTAEDPHDASDALVKQITKLQREYDALKRKYDALANSRLGSFTLRLWEKRANKR